jgi:hypothetical protein
MTEIGFREVVPLIQKEDTIVDGEVNDFLGVTEDGPESKFVCGALPGVLLHDPGFQRGLGTRHVPGLHLQSTYCKGLAIR